MSSLKRKLLEEASKRPLTVAEFMEKALYDPEEGYYSSHQDNIGLSPTADFFTSPAFSPIFGMTIARLVIQLDEMLEHPSPFVFLEAGAGDGTTAIQVVEYIEKHRPQMLARFSYLALELNGTRLSKLSQNTAHLSCVTPIADIELQPITGMIFSNEFFDALPVHRIIKSGETLKEIHLGVKGDNFEEIELPLSDPRLLDFLAKENIELADGQIADISLEWEVWAKKLATKLEKGIMMTIDYGYPAYELFSPLRKKGTLRAYRSHKISENYYDDPGMQDITAHVDFTAIAMAGEEVGLTTIGLSDQLRTFLALGVHEVLAEIEKECVNFTQYQIAIQPAKALIMPGGMGEIFKVLAQYRDLDEPTSHKLYSLIPPKYKLIG